MNIWVEKYRPKSINDLKLSEDNLKKFNKFISEGEIPHLILHGPPGTGKTSIANILIKTINCNFKKINGSDSRGIDVIREEISSFVKIKFSTNWTIIFYDEGEALTKDAWMALKGVIEKNKKVRFIFTTNHINKVPKAIRSRCQEFEFTKLDKNILIDFYKDILIKEKIEYVENDLEKVWKICNGDLRKSLNYLQGNSCTGKLVFKEEIYDVVIDEITKSLKTCEISNLKEYFAKNSVDYDYIYRRLYEKINTPDKLLIIGKYLYQNSLVVDPEINFVSCICDLIKLKKDKK